MLTMASCTAAICYEPYRRHWVSETWIADKRYQASVKPRLRKESPMACENRVDTNAGLAWWCVLRRPAFHQLFGKMAAAGSLADSIIQFV